MADKKPGTSTARHFGDVLKDAQQAAAETQREEAHDHVWAAEQELAEARSEGTISKRAEEASHYIERAVDRDEDHEWRGFVEDVRRARALLLEDPATSNTPALKAALESCNQAVACIERAEALQAAVMDREIEDRMAAPDLKSTAARFMEMQAAAGEQNFGHEREEGTYWREEEGQRFTLVVEDEPRAVVVGLLNVAFVGPPEQDDTTILAIPDSGTAFDAVEEFLGTGRVAEMIGEDGRPAPHLREQAEDKATAFRRQHPASREPQLYLRQAWEFLGRAEVHGSLSKEGAQAQIHVRAALRDYENSGHWTAGGREETRRAHEALPGHQGGGASLEVAASIECQKALTSLEYGRAAELQGGADAGRAGNDNPEQEKGWGDTSWSQDEDKGRSR